jgi:hypothetical protein
MCPLKDVACVFNDENVCNTAVKHLNLPWITDMGKYSEGR